MVREYASPHSPFGDEPYQVTDDDVADLLEKEGRNLPISLNLLPPPYDNLVLDIYDDVPDLSVEALQRGNPDVLGRDYGYSAAFFDTVDSQGERIIKIDQDGEMSEASQDEEGKWTIKHIGKYRPLLAHQKTYVSPGEELALEVEKPQRVWERFQALIPGDRQEPKKLRYGVINRIFAVSRDLHEGHIQGGSLPTMQDLPEGLPTSFFIPEQTHVAKRELRQAARAAQRHSTPKAA